MNNTAALETDPISDSVALSSSAARRRGEQAHGYLAFALAIVLFGTAMPVSRIVTAEVSVLQGTAIRLTVAALLFVPLLWRRRDEVLALSGSQLALIALTGLTLAGVSGLMLCSTRFAPCSALCVVTSLLPAVTAAGAILFLRERVRIFRLSWIVVAIIGIVLLKYTTLGMDGGTVPTGYLIAGLVIAFVAVCCEAAGTLLSKAATHHTSPLLVAALSTLVAAVFIIPIAASQQGMAEFGSISTRAWIASIWWGSGGLACASWLWCHGLRMSDGTTGAAFLSALPFATLLLSWIIV